MNQKKNCECTKLSDKPCLDCRIRLADTEHEGYWLRYVRVTEELREHKAAKRRVK